MGRGILRFIGLVSDLWRAAVCVHEFSTTISGPPEFQLAHARDDCKCIEWFYPAERCPTHFVLDADICGKHDSNYDQPVLLYPNHN